MDADEPVQKRDVNATVERDVTGNDGGGKTDADEPVQKHDVNATVEHDVTGNDGGGKTDADEPVHKRDVNATVERDVTENDGDIRDTGEVDESLQKHDINATVPADQPILISPQPHPTGNEQVIPSHLHLDSIVDLSGQMLIDAQTG